MKNQYVKPMATIENFVPNEFVSLCIRWGVSCDIEKSNAKELELKHTSDYYKHREGQCGQFDHQAVYDKNNDGIADEMIEEKTDQGKGNLPCTVYTDETYSLTKAISTIQPSDYIYWRTSKWAFTWSHQGTVQQVGKTTGHS